MTRNESEISRMEEFPTKPTGGCHCGAVRYEATGAPLYVPYCHCETCRKTTGAPVVLFVMFKEDQVQFTKGVRKVYRSSPSVKRTFCGDCGTPLSYEGGWGGSEIIEIYISTLDAPEQFKPDRHVFHGEHIDWFDVADQLPRYIGSSTGAQPYQIGPNFES